MVQDLRASLGSDAGSPRLKSTSTLRSAAMAAMLVTDSNHMTPRKYIKTIHAVVTSLAKHTQLLSAAVQSSLQVPGQASYSTSWNCLSVGMAPHGIETQECLDTAKSWVVHMAHSIE